MELKDFDHVRVGSGFPASFDIIKVSHHENYGLIAKTFLFADGTNFVQLRKHNTDNFVFLVHFKYNDINLDPYYSDSEILWDSRSNAATDGGAAQ